MFKRLEFAAWFAGGPFRRVSDPAPGRPEVRRLADKLDEFVRRVRRAGLLLILSVGGLLALTLFHPLAFLLWFIALPLAGFASVLSMLWPTRQFRKRGSAARPKGPLPSALSRLASSRSEIPLRSRAAFDLAARRLKAVEVLANDEHTLLAEEAKRVGGQHLPRLVASFVALPPDERTDARVSAFMEGLSAISEELESLRERLLRERTDCFEIQRQFVESRFPRRDGLASV